MTAPDPEEFAAWKAHPTTQWVLEAYDIMACRQRDQWSKCSWEGGHCDSYTLLELRTRADAYRSLSECDLSDLISAHEPEAE